MTVWESVTANARLVTLPEIYLRLKEMIDSPDFSMADVALLIGQDPALTARLLKLVNSSYFNLATKIDSVFRAVSMLGVRQIHDLVLATSVARAFSTSPNGVMDVSTFWRNSLQRAVAARELARTAGAPDHDRLFVTGLLGDIGHMVMYQVVPGPCRIAEEATLEREQPLHLAEREIVGIDYARVGGMLMRQWKLPARLREAIEFHVEPRRALEYPSDACILHLASLLVVAVRTGRTFGVADLAPQPVCLELLGLSTEQVLAVQAGCAADNAQGLDAILPPAAGA